MAVSVRARIIANDSLVFLRFTGVQDLQMAMEELKAMRALPAYRPGLPELADLSAVTRTGLDFNAMRTLVHDVTSLGVDPQREKRIAIFAPQDTLYGMARMFSTLTELEPGNVRGAAFRTQGECLEWLGRPERDFADIPGYDLVPMV
ncbi:hypothetical protein [Tropicibacter oceani]|uniref:STAS/SEC14 domain-containing protein n=1 Tax=Tropicibacter oceani TaxID=3058420 RepID=A0ABY8QEM1_9RHOB|nr:hypothetical protein [Tropicibacter oceani]WGW02451.1 hypothetical protein QF118_10875 [Tropicibacter oceani]